MRAPWFFALAAFAACGDAEPTTRITVRVVEEALGPGDPARPIASARVAFDPPGRGARIEAVTDAEGRLSFEANLESGSADVSAVSPDHTLVTRVDITAADAKEELTLALPRLDAALTAGTVGLRGRITGKERPSDRVDTSVSGVVRLGRMETDDGAYALRRRPGLASQLFVHIRRVPDDATGVLVAPHVKSFIVELPPSDVDTAVDLDVGAAPSLPIRSARLVAEVPAVMDGPQTRCSATSATLESRAALGVSTREGFATGVTCELELVTVDDTNVRESPATRVSLVTASGARSVRTERGGLADGSTVTEFLAPLVIPEASRSLKDAIPLDGYPAGGDLRAEVYAAGQLVWIVKGPDGRAPAGGALRLPPPLGLDFSADVQLLAVSVTVRDGPLAENIFRREATSADVIVRRR